LENPSPILSPDHLFPLSGRENLIFPILGRPSQGAWIPGLLSHYKPYAPIFLSEALEALFQPARVSIQPVLAAGGIYCDIIHPV
jgi:hypothetical protein